MARGKHYYAHPVPGRQSYGITKTYLEVHKAQSEIGSNKQRSISTFRDFPVGIWNLMSVNGEKNGILTGKRGSY